MPQFTATLLFYRFFAIVPNDKTMIDFAVTMPIEFVGS